MISETVLISITLHDENNLSFFHFQHVMTALQGDGRLIGTDQAFEKMKGLQLTYPLEFSANSVQYAGILEEVEKGITGITGSAFGITMADQLLSES